MLTEVAISSSNTDPVVYVWDIRTGSTLFSFRQSTSGRNALALVPKPGCGLQCGAVLTAQVDRGVINMYTWQRDHAQHKMPMPEKLVTLAASPDGALVAGATAQGRVFLWQVATGLLLRTFEAHYRHITRMAFQGDTLVTASEDATVRVWLLSELMDAEQEPDVLPAPLRDWTDHTLPIEDLALGASSRIYTASMDRTVKVWDDELLTTFLFPQPAKAIVVDPSETKMFVACNDRIYPVELYRRQHDTAYGGDRIQAVGGLGRVVEATGESFVGHR